MESISIQQQVKMEAAYKSYITTMLVGIVVAVSVTDVGVIRLVNVINNCYHQVSLMQRW